MSYYRRSVIRRELRGLKDVSNGARSPFKREMSLRSSRTMTERKWRSSRENQTVEIPDVDFTGGLEGLYCARPGSRRRSDPSANDSLGYSLVANGAVPCWTEERDSRRKDDDVASHAGDAPFSEDFKGSRATERGIVLSNDASGLKVPSRDGDAPSNQDHRSGNTTTEQADGPPD
ncbi:hypothetical protein BDR22DRAFT_826962 [Usnea florida]